MARAEDTDLMITEDAGDKKTKAAKHGKKEKETKVEKITLADSMAYAEALSD